jgi:hypothetical protein
LSRRLTHDLTVVDAYEKAPLVNFIEAGKEPIHRWFFVREGYSPTLVRQSIGEFGLRSGGLVLDPFCGGGTTLVASQKRGLSSTGYDVNPLMAFASKVKTRPYTQKDHDDVRRLVADMKTANFKPTLRAPPELDAERVFSDNVLEKLLMFKEFINKVESQTVRDFLKLGWLSILEQSSNMRRGGTGLRYEPRYGKDPKKLLFEKYAAMMEDLSVLVRERPRPQATVVEDSFLTSGGKLEDASASAVITSPPYPNCFDYTQIYGIELLMGDFVKGERGLEAVNDGAIRSHTRMKLAQGRKWENKRLTESLNLLLRRIPPAHLWDPKIPVMLDGYFADMEDAIRLMHAKLAFGGSAHLVAGNVSYGGAVIPVDLMLSQIALDEGFKDISVQVVRLLAPELPPEQLAAGGKLLRESIISMRK